MTDETPEQAQPPVEAGGGAHVSVVNGGEDVEVLFKDGWHVVPRWIVADLGGPERFREGAKALTGYTYDLFIRGFGVKQERKTLNAIGARYVSSALRGLGRF